MTPGVPEDFLKFKTGLLRINMQHKTTELFNQQVVVSALHSRRHASLIQMTDINIRCKQTSNAVPVWHQCCLELPSFLLHGKSPILGVSKPHVVAFIAMLAAAGKTKDGHAAGFIAVILSFSAATLGWSSG